MIKTSFMEVIHMFFSKKRYLNWPEYKERISKIENLMFIDKTARQSIKNYWQRGAKNDMSR
jgi:hypothetical protein